MSTPLHALKSEFFRMLANPTRIRILEQLVPGERSVQDLQSVLTLDQPIVSQQLARLRASGVVTTAKSGTTVTYALADPLLKDLLRVAKDILNRRLTGAQVLLRELRRHHA